MISYNIFSQWISWHFIEVPKKILKGWKNFLKFNLNYFSLPDLIKSYFTHWRRYRWKYPKGLKIGKIFEVFVSNLFSRLIGMTARSILILIGILTEVFLLILGTIVFLSWLTLPLILILGVFLGLKLLFGA